MNTIRTGAFVTIECFTSAVSEAAPVLLSNIVQLGFEDERIGKMFLGMSFIFSGAVLLAQRNPSNLKNAHTWKVEKATSKNYLQITRALFGSLLVCFGVYQIALGVHGFAFPKKPSEEKHRFPQTSYREQHAFTFPKISFVEKHEYAFPKILCEDKIDQARMAFMTCPESKTLWDAVKTRGNFSIECVPASVAPHGGVTNPIMRQIFLSRSLVSVEPSVLFELNNLEQNRETLRIATRMCSMNPLDYVRSMEALEYNSARETYRIAEACSQRKIWPEDWNIYKLSFTHPTKGWRSVEDYIEYQIKTGHSQHYFQQRERYCAKFKPMTGVRPNTSHKM